LSFKTTDLKSVGRKAVRVRLPPLGTTTKSNSCGQQVNDHLLPVFVSLNLVSPATRSLVRTRGGLSDVADVVLEELPITSTFHPHVRAAVRRLPVDRPAVRHDR
jgi:hypothetical protein